MRYFETRKARIEIIPMIDIMLFLLVFFAMLTLRMIPTSGQVTKLPTSSTAVTIPPPKLLVEITADGSLQVENRKEDQKEQHDVYHRDDFYPGLARFKISHFRPSPGRGSVRP